MAKPTIRFRGFDDEWEQRKLGDITVKIGSGKTPSGGKSTYVETGIPLIRSQNVNGDKVDFADIVFINEATDESMANSRVYTNDVLLNITGASIGRSAVYKGLESANVNQHVCIIRPTEGYQPDFIQLNLSSDNGQKQIDASQAGGGREGLNFQEIGKMQFSFPSLNEQKCIGRYFNSLDHLITLHQRKCDETKKLKKYMLQKMFPQNGSKVPEIRFKGFTDEWEQRKLGQISDSYSGGTPTAGKKEYYDGDIPFIRSGEIGSDKTELFITEEGLNSSSAKMVTEGDILYALYGATSGEVSISKLKGAINQAILAIQPHNGYDSQFIMQWLRKSKESIISTYLQGGQGNLSGNIVKELLIELPTYDEQEQIGGYFERLDNLITLHQHKCEELKKLKKFMLQNMFTQKNK